MKNQFEIISQLFLHYERKFFFSKIFIYILFVIMMFFEKIL